ncbi:cytochrome P450 [Streptosporangium roseum]|uniref:Cytochrome P450 n=1 Tax=Streptosporangium roseum (strain ATCC 12428 / DSM 43021 / JCM 3005 / KCTC 9067 / NCIMB 10171 / NRRL 2505 / NI 9100) TaxID=479432 RepID=D2AYJ7_STRRD|nr:cytochrome P450 [Streptosporangium roseum]ACZ88980.1 putative cytochrome P450 [Streptosporangium roseum DSM 43021]
MTEAPSCPVTFPTARRHLFDPPGEVLQWQRQGALHRMTFADGHLGWLLTGHSAARAVLADNRFSNRTELTHPPVAHPLARQENRQPLPGFFLRLDQPEHTRFRRLLTGQFTVRRMRQLEPRIEEITSDRLDAMERGDRPADLVQAFALPIPSLVICELLGVPYGDREQFQRDSAALLNLESSAEQMGAALVDLMAYMRDLVLRKRAEPADDLLGGLVAGGELDDEELTGVALLLLIAGHETTANMLALGTFALLRDPAQLALLRDDPAVAESAVEELLRYLTIIHMGPVRTALEDVELDGHLIRAGESVAFSLPAANRDPERFENPDTLDVTRPATGHLSFGHGIHQCLGQQLARAEMRIAYPALLRRFPGLRLAVPPEEVPMRSHMTIYGVHRLPVTW